MHAEARSRDARFARRIVTFIVTSLAGFGICLLLAVVATWPSAPAPAAPRAAAVSVVFDVPRWTGKSPQDFRAVFGAPVEAKRCVPGYLVAAPGGGDRHAYKTDWGAFDVTFAGGSASGFLIELLRPRARGVDEALQRVNLPTGQRTDRMQSPSIRVWDNLAGYSVGMTSDTQGRVDDIVQLNIRHHSAGPASVPKGDGPYCVDVPV